MKRHQLTSFYLEALLLVVIFVAMILVLTGVFGAAKAQSVQAKRLSQAVTLAANAADAVAAADSLEQAAALLDEGGNVRIADGEFDAAYRIDGHADIDGSGALHVIVRWTPSAEDPSLIYSEIAVYARGGTAPIYTLDTAHYRKGAAA